MFHPVEHPMERGWVGRIEDGHVVHLAAQTLQSYFTGGGARDHAVYPLAAVRLLAPVLHPPSIRAFEDERSFEFRNPAAVIGPGAAVPPGLGLHPRLAAVVGADGEIAGFTLCADWRDPSAHPPKDRDFALGLGPAVVTPDELPLEPGEAIVTVNGDEVLRTTPPAFDWAAARDFAAARTALYPGDLLLAPAAADALAPSGAVSVDFASIGPLVQAVDLHG
jgi:fumarylacetoacetate (FAA) hydrolase